MYFIGLFFPYLGTAVSPTNPGQCLSVQQCTGNNDCPNNAFCDKEKKVCVCPEPNQGPNCESKFFSLLELIGTVSRELFVR